MPTPGRPTAAATTRPGLPTSARAGGRPGATATTPASAARASGTVGTPTASATVGAGAPRCTPSTLPGEFGTSPFGSESFGGLPGLARARAVTSPGAPVSLLTGGRGTATVTTLPGNPTSIARYGTAAARAITARALALDLDALLDEASAQADRVPVFGLRADWDGDSSYHHPLSELNPVVTDFTIDREIASELPDDIGIIQGVAATKLTATLGGGWTPTGSIPGQDYVTGVYTLMPTGGGAEQGWEPTDLAGYITAGFTFGLEFSATYPCQIDAIRYWRPLWGGGSGDSPVVATQGGIWNVTTQAEEAGTHVTVPTPPSGWGWQDVPLPAPFFPVVGQRYKVALLYTTFAQHFDYFVPGGDGDTTIDFGPLRRYSQNDATGGFQSSWKTTSVYGYPNTGDSRGKAYGLDIVASTRVPLTGNPTATETDPVKAFAPYRLDADLAGRSIIGKKLSVTTGMQTRRGPIVQQRFTGTVSGFEPSSAARQVVLEGLDPVDHLRAPITQAAWGVDYYEATNPYSEATHRARMNSQWYVDRICRANGFFASPAPGVPLGDSRLLFSATMHGSTVAEVAANTRASKESYFIAPTPTPTPFAVGDHPFGMLAPNPDYLTMLGSWGLGFPVSMEPGNGYAMPIWIRVPAAGSTINQSLVKVQPVSQSFARMEISLANGVPQISLITPNNQVFTHIPPGYTLPAQPEWQFFGFWWNFTSSTSATFSVYSASLGARTGAVLTHTSWSAPDYNPSAPIFYQAYVPFTNVSLYKQYTEPNPSDWVGETWSPSAHIDVGANDWGGILEQRGTESYDLLKEIVAAEFGHFGFDEDGIPHFRSRAVEHPVVRFERVTADRALTDLVTRVDESTVRNSIDIEAVQYVLQPWTPIFEAERPDEFILPGAPPGGVSRTDFYIPLPDNCGEIYTGSSLRGLVPPMMFDDDTWNDATNNPALADRIIFAASFVNTPTVAPNAAAMTFATRFVNSRTMLLRITNNNVSPIRLATPDSLSGTGATASTSPGEAALRIPGRIVGPNEPELTSVTDAASIARYGRRTYDLGGASIWRQRLDSAVPLAHSVLEWTATPKPVLAEIEVPHNPRRKLHDQVTVVDPEGLGAVTGKLAAVRQHFSAGDGARDSLLVRPNLPPTGW